MKKIRISKKKCIWFASAAAALILFLVLQCIRVILVSNQPSQTMADRWSETKDVAQISCFFPKNAAISRDQVIGFGHSLDSKLLEESITVQSENPSARLWMDAYSTDGSVTLAKDNKTVTVNALGVGGDFFRFHPVELLYGQCFYESDLNQDYILIDEDIAWQLFGSNDVAGMQVDIGNRPVVVSGVIQRDDSRLAKAAGLDKPLVYLSYMALSELNGEEPALNHYEIVMPNPVTDYAVDKVKELMGVDEGSMTIVDNTHRYTFLSGLKWIPNFDLRSMSEKAIIYPYWENIARSKEDINGLFVLLQLPPLLYLTGFVLVNIMIWYRHKTWTASQLIGKAKDKMYDISASMAEKRRHAKENGKQIKKEEKSL